MSVNHTKENIIAIYPTVFQGLGCLEKPYHIQVDTSVPPVVNAPRNQPAALRDRIKEALDDMENKGVIRKVEEPTDWVSSMVVVEKPKSKKLRICLDPQMLNRAIKREHFQLPTIEDITTRLAGAQIFTKLDANHSYWQVPLDPESQILTTFNTPFGRYCYMRMPFGITSAQEVFQKRMSQLLGDIVGVETDIDDVLVWGRTQSEHNERLEKVLKRCQECHITLNTDKCEFNIPSVKYIGHILSAEGVKADPDKVVAVTEMPAPTDKKGVERLLGTVNYLAKFIPNMSEKTAPIRMLLKHDVQFEWSQAQEKAFDKIKETLAESPVLAFFDPKKPVTVSCDASQSGLGAFCLQNGKPVAYASRAMTECEQRYAQIEKELLAVVFSFERFHQYTYGQHVMVESDHKPLETIVKKSLAAAPPRLQRMLLRLQRYTFTLKYKPGKELIVADALSRAYLPNSDHDQELQDEIEYMVHATILQKEATDEMLQKIQNATTAEFETLKQTILSGWPETLKETPEQAKAYFTFREELSVVNSLILKGTRIVIPPSLKGEILQCLHTSHLGVEKSRQRAREAVYWPNMNHDIEVMISKCKVCLESRDSLPKEPMILTEQPQRPWEAVATDLFTLDGANYVLVVDYFSRFVEISLLKDRKSKTVINHMKAIFARHGIPQTVRSDNGPQYVSSDFKAFAKQWSFKHVTSSPYYSQGNGLAEAYVKIVKKTRKKAQKAGDDPYPWISGTLWWTT
jgi:hypothetical protein